jgi:lactate dehydrogenase-like 2-hydroxyacid dehydrogenase|tara:strand:- start:2648 stop:3466 length:819 start_codon:yes stop_codon:yes gene_type:complete
MVKVILKDKKDMNVLKTMEDLWSTEDYEIVGSQDEILRNLDVEILSVKFSKVGQKTFDAYPNLKWIVCRSHGYDNVNVDLAKKYNIGIVCTNPNTQEVADWILRKVLGKNALVFGSGRIGKRFKEMYEYNNNTCTLINSKTVFDFSITKEYDTIVICSSPTDKPILTSELLKDFKGGIVSVSRPCCIDNQALLDAINCGKIGYAAMDMLDPKLRKELEETKICKYYKHTAWGNDKIYDEYYFKDLFKEIDMCLNYESNNVVVDRKVNILFGN